MTPDRGDHQRGPSVDHWSRLYRHVHLEGPHVQEIFVRLVFRPDVQAVFGYVVDEIESALQRRFEAENWSASQVGGPKGI